MTRRDADEVRIGAVEVDKIDLADRGQGIDCDTQVAFCPRIGTRQPAKPHIKIGCLMLRAAGEGAEHEHAQPTRGELLGDGKKRLPDGRVQPIRAGRCVRHAIIVNPLAPIRSELAEVR